MTKVGFGSPKNRSRTKIPQCPDCGHDLELRDCRRIKIDGKRYGMRGMFWVCNEPQCNYRKSVK